MKKLLERLHLTFTAQYKLELWITSTSNMGFTTIVSDRNAILLFYKGTKEGFVVGWPGAQFRIFTWWQKLPTLNVDSECNNIHYSFFFFDNFKLPKKRCSQHSESVFKVSDFLLLVGLNFFMKPLFGGSLTDYRDT